MNFLTALYTDVGTRKKTNQDSMLIMQAATNRGQILLASVCDGMGGLAKGELASAEMIRALSAWFTGRLPGILDREFGQDTIWNEWTELIDNTSRKIMQYGESQHSNLGTTIVGLLIIGQTYYLMNVGDSRIYCISDYLYQLTKDQSVVQTEIDAGRLTYEQSLSDPRRSILTQCVGASQEVHPEFLTGEAHPGEVFLLCSDGFRHAITSDEIYQTFHPNVLTSGEIMNRRLKEMTDLNIARHEDDNISAMLIKCSA